MRTINQVLDKARMVQKLPSDYKLALTLGIGGNAISNYRNGRSFPDEKACQKLAVAMGEDPINLMVEMQVQRTKDDESRAMWSALARRLQTGVSSVLFSSVVAIVAIAASAVPVSVSAVSVASENGPTVYYVKSVIGRLGRAFEIIVIFGKQLSFLGFKGNICPL